MPPRKQKPPKPAKSTESVYGPDELWQRLGEIAASDRRSKSELIVGILEEWLEAHERERAKK